MQQTNSIISSASIDIKLFRNGYVPLPLEGKRCLLSGWNSLSITEDVISRWEPRTTAGIRTDNLLTIDIDIKNDEHAAIVAKAIQDKFDATPVVRRGVKGCALFYRCEASIRKQHITGYSCGTKERALVELFGDSGHYIAALGKHPEGIDYRYDDGRFGGTGLSPLDIPASELPEIEEADIPDLVALIECTMEELGYELPSVRQTGAKGQMLSFAQPHAKRVLETQLRKVREAQNGTRNDKLNTAAFTLGGLVGAGQLSDSEVREKLRIAARECGLPDTESLGVINRALEDGTRRPLQNRTPNAFSHNDKGNAEWLVATFGSDIRYAPQVNKWLVWNGSRWAWDEGRLIIERMAKDTTNLMIDEARMLLDERARSDLLRHAARSGNKKAIDGMIGLARSEPGVGVLVEELDSHPRLLGVGNGVIDLEAGRMLDPDRSFLITRHSPVKYDPNAVCPRWGQFVEECSNGDPELPAFLQRLCGYLAFGHAKEQKLPILYGLGANGKSTFTDTIRFVLGDYAARVQSSLISDTRKSHGPSEELYVLRGIRAAFSAETKNGCVLDEALVKEVTGEESITCRPLYGSPVTFPVTFKVVSSTNHMPIIHGTDDGVWRRILLIPFTAQIPEDRRDSHLGEALKAEAEGILRWIVEGAVAYAREGLKVPDSITRATNAYREDMDVFGDWLQECCEIAPDAETPTGILHQYYVEWCKEGGCSFKNNRQFGRELKRRGFPTRKGGGGKRMMVGIQLKND